MNLTNEQSQFATLTVTVNQSGLYSTFQDKGRTGAQHVGIPFSGAMDKRAAILANQLVGNANDTPVIEQTLNGGVFHVDQACTIAITGADLGATVNGKYVSRNQFIQVNRNSTIAFAQPKDGCFGYLAIGGRWKVEKYMNSVSPLPASDILPQHVLQKDFTFSIMLNDKPVSMVQDVDLPSKDKPLRLLQGIEWQQFTKKQKNQLLSQPFTLSTQCNRMGYRVNEVLADYDNQMEMISSPVVPGTIQVTNEGKLIILMADAQTTGGYPRIGTLIEKDIDRVAQKRPGDTIRFTLVKDEDQKQD